MLFTCHVLLLLSAVPQPLQGMLVNPAQPWAKRFILLQCYVRNSGETRQRFRDMDAKLMHKVMRE
jgi:hypothetical protein